VVGKGINKQLISIDTPDLGGWNSQNKKERKVSKFYRFTSIIPNVGSKLLKKQINI